MISEAKKRLLKRNSNEARKKISISVARFFNQSNLCKGVVYSFLLKNRVIQWRGGRSALRTERNKDGGKPLAGVSAFSL